MESKGLLIAVGALAVLSAGVWWTNKNPKETAKKAGEVVETLTTFNERELSEVTLTQRGEAPIVLRRGTAGWELAVEPKLPTSATDALDVVTNASTVSTLQLVDANATDLAQYGLEPALISVKLKDKNGKTQEWLVGEQTPVGLNFYARRAGERKVYTIARSYRDSVAKGVNDIRDKRLLITDDAKVTKIEVARKAGALEFGRNKQTLWQLVKPQVLRTESNLVDEILMKLKEAKFDPLRGEDVAKKANADFAAATPVATIRVTDAAGTKQIELRRTKDNEVLAKSDTVEGAHKVSEELAKATERSIEELRTKKLFDFGFVDPSKVEYTNAGKTTVLEQKDDVWTMNGKKPEPESLYAALDVLRGMVALKFAEGKFTTPVATVAVTYGKPGIVEKLEIAKVGNYVYARRVGETGEYELDPKTLSDLEAAIAKIKEAGGAKK
jgi:hypothetical protein